MQSIADQIRNIRNTLGMTQVQLADRTGFTQSQIAEIESGKRYNLSVSTVEKLAKGLNCDAIIEVRLKKDTPQIIEDRIDAVAQKIVSTTSGTTALELQLPNQKVINEELEKVKKILEENPKIILKIN